MLLRKGSEINGPETGIMSEFKVQETQTPFNVYMLVFLVLVL